MSITMLNPYLNFNGDAKQAIALYESALGAKTEDLMRFGDVPDMTPNPAHRDRIMHAKLRLDQGIVMISDTMPDQPITARDGAQVQVCLHFSDTDDMARKFDALAAGGGKVDHALHDTFWGARYGQLTDRFGVQWLFHFHRQQT